MIEIPKTIIIMPVANEEETMEKVIDMILSLPYDNLFLYPVVDEYSRDSTKEIIARRQNLNSKIKMIYYKESTGVVSCYLEGFRRAIVDGAEFIIEMDGGMSHNPEQLPCFIDKLLEGYDCVWGSRFIKGGSNKNSIIYRRILSRGGTMLANVVLGTDLKDMTSGFEAFKRNVLLNMDFDHFLSKGHIYQTEMRYYCRNLNGVEIPIVYKSSSSSLRIKSILEALNVLFRLRKNEPYIWKVTSTNS